jgi:hypothetical protein
MPGKTPMWGNPMRERERDLLFSFRKVHISNKTTFPAKENTSQHQIYPIEICLIFHAKTYRCLASSVPRFLCPQSVVRTIPYGPKTTTENLKITSKIVPKIPSIFMPNPYDCMDYTDPYSTDSHSRKKIWPKITEKNFSGIMPTFLENYALFSTHFPLSILLRKSL